jgi:transposase-like protein
MGRRFTPLELDERERAELTSLASRRSTAQALALRARIVLACADGEQSKVVAARLAIDPDTVGKWRRRFTSHRLEGLLDEPRSGTPRTIEDTRIEAVIVRTLETRPPDATHWSSRDLPLNFHPLAIRVSAGFTPSGAGVATCDRRSWSGLRSRSHVAVRLAA